jgi:putative transposase
LIIQTAVEAEVTEFLGRARYQRAVDCPDARAGSRNGYCPTTVKTTAGPVTIERPKLRGTTEAFCSRLFGKGITKSNALESLVIAGFVRGLSVRDVEATLADALGAKAALSKSTVCQAIRDELDAWSARRLDDVALDTCSWTRRCSRCTPARGPPRCSPRGASPATASPSSSAWRPARPSLPTPGPSWFPWVDVAPDGTVGVIYNDRRPGNTHVAELAEGAPGGVATQVVSQALSHPDESLFFQAGVPGCETCATFHGDYLGLDYGSDGVANLAWTDMRDQDLETGLYRQFIYFARR